MKVAPAALIVALLLSGCTGLGSPDRLARPITEFHNAIIETQTAMEDGLANLRADRASNRIADLKLNRPRVRPSAACSFSNETDEKGVLLGVCTLIAEDAPSNVGVSPAFTQEHINRVKIDALLRYTAALQALADAQTTRQLQAATDNLAASAGSVALAAGPQGAAAAPVIVAAVKTAGTAIIIYDANRRFQAIREAVNQTDRHVDVVATTLGTYLDIIREERRQTILADARLRSAAVRAAGETPSSKDYEARLADAMTRPAAITELQQASGRQTAQAIKAAHSALVAAANDPAASVADLIAAMDQVTASTKALRRAMAAKSKQSSS